MRIPWFNPFVHCQAPGKCWLLSFLWSHSWEKVLLWRETWNITVAWNSPWKPAQSHRESSNCPHNGCLVTWGSSFLLATTFHRDASWSHVCTSCSMEKAASSPTLGLSQTVTLQGHAPRRSFSGHLLNTYCVQGHAVDTSTPRPGGCRCKTWASFEIIGGTRE